MPKIRIPLKPVALVIAAAVAIATPARAHISTEAPGVRVIRGGGGAYAACHNRAGVVLCGADRAKAATAAYGADADGGLAVPPATARKITVIINKRPERRRLRTHGFFADRMRAGH